MTRIASNRPRRLPGLFSAAGYGVGIPALLVRAAGWPLPRRLPSWSAIGAALSGQWRPNDHFVISALAIIAWAVWAQIGAVTLSELRTIRSGRPARTVPWSAWCRPIALRLATTLAVLAPLAPRAAGATPLPISNAAARAVATSPAPAPPGQLGVEPSVAAVQVATVVHIVRPDETLWDIARTRLGDPLRWRELFDLNRDRPQPDGRRLEDQDLLRPGWRIELPVPPPVTPDSPGPATTTALSGPGTGCSPAPTPGHAPAVTTPTTAAPTTAGPNSPDPPPPAATIPAPSSPAGHNDDTVTTGDHDETPPVPSLNAPAVARIGLPALTGGVLLGYLGGLRRDRERRRRRHHRFPAPTAAQQAAERTVRAVARTDAPRWVDLALRHLAAALAEDGAPPPPTLRAVLAGDAGVEVLVSPPWPVAPGRFLPQDDGQIWRLDPTLGLDELTTLVAGAPAYVPGVVTIGETDRGAVLIDVADTGSLLLEGDPKHTNAIAAAMAAELAAAPWSETCDVCLVGVAPELEALERVQALPTDTAVAELVRLAGHEGQSGLTDGAQGDIPAALTIAVVGAGALPSDELAALVAAARPHSGLAVIAATPAASGIAGRFRLVCDQGGTALLYPLGLTVTPAQPHDIAKQLVELLAATARASDVPLNADGSAPPTVESAEQPATDPDNHREVPDAELIDGAGTATPPNHEDGAPVRVESIAAPERVGTVTEAVPDSETPAGNRRASDLAPNADGNATGTPKSAEELWTDVNDDNDVAEIEPSAGTNIASDLAPNGDGNAPARIESPEEPVTDGNDEEASNIEPSAGTGITNDLAPNGDGNAPARVESAEEPAMNGNDEEVPNIEPSAGTGITNDLAPKTARPAADAVELAEEPGTGSTAEAPVPGATIDATSIESAVPRAVAEVRVLGPIEITWRRKAPKRQIAELVSYLAVHPRGVSSDEARLALWPATADDKRFGERAPATFWALTTKARGALGEDSKGNPLLIREANNGLRLSAAVRCDWLEFQRLVAEGRRNPAQATGCLKAALSLVRGRPFQASVFPWVEVERLDGVMEAVISDAAADLAELALESGDLATARFAVNQGLLGVPHAEGLVRLAMRIAAAAGDRAGIERAWRDAQRIAIDLDPLGVPEPETAQLYEALRRKDPS
ncbi:MAG TPA: hypothetical protein VHL53_00515 [Acidimicrobiia bacterium]|nr:hypothetical protein [Acidimicrobiia bacterium]